MTQNIDNIYGTFEAAKIKSMQVEENLKVNPHKYRILTGERPTGNLHIGHYFGSLQNRTRIQNIGVETFIIIADYQVLTDREIADKIAETIIEIVKDYLAIGLDPENGRTFIFPHSHVPELNQLMLPFLTLVTNAELNRNPTVKEEISASGMKNINAGMYTYPIHQAADILFCKGNLVPVGKDQLPHLEITRTIARRFNNKFARGKRLFPEPVALLSEAPTILGIDGSQKMSKSRNNAIMISATADETAELIKKAKTDSERLITYDPKNRPEVSNLILLGSMCSNESPETYAAKISDGGAGKLKQAVTDSINNYFAPIRAKRIEYDKNPDYIISVLKSGIARAREEATITLDEVREAMNMKLF
ncbi:MAG: tryptophan--tRNA ligase [Lentisphaerae bacterium]|nr:tryptophan--tRNA ligase [Lentisphaerota bacterium]